MSQTYVGGTAAAALSPAQIEALWEQAGGSAASAATAAAISEAESSGIPNNVNLTDPSGGSFGLFQINGIHAADLAADGLTNWQTDPLQNAEAAVIVSGGSTATPNFSPWSTYTNGKYLSFLPSIESAATQFVVGDQIGGAGATVAGTTYSATSGAAGTTPAVSGTAATTTPATAPDGGFLGIPGAISAAVSSLEMTAEQIALSVFVGALALALLSGGIIWLASGSPAAKAAVKAAV